jgi:predicted secreted hydrolase
MRWFPSLLIAACVSHGIVINKARVSLPTDDAPHDAPIEWWYWTGHLHSTDGRWFGFEEVFFRIKLHGLTAHSVHFAITDVAGKGFHHMVRDAFLPQPSVPDGFDWAIAGVTAKGGGGRDALRGAVDDFGIDLQLAQAKPPVLQHDGGYTTYPFGGFTYYYSRERMTAKGSVLLPDHHALPVEGTAWFDHQWGDLEKAVEGGWDWFGLQLDDGREAMLFLSRQPGWPMLVGGSLSDAAARTTALAADDVAVTPLGSFTSQAGCTYPSGWTVRIKDVTLTLKPVLDDQAMPTKDPDYWEGAVEISGGATGRGYVELTNYCR